MTTATEVAIPEPLDAALVTTDGPDPFGILGRYITALDEARKFADTVCMTPLVPKFYQGNPKAATVAILHGLELGLHPLQALQQIFVVHGMPAIYARTMVALLKQRGFRFETIQTGPAHVVVQAWSPDGKESEVGDWTIERADQAGYIPKTDPATGAYAVNKNGNLIGNEKYITEPENMLWAKAAAEACRRLAPDVLLGISRTVEDIESEPEPVRVQSERVTTADDSVAAAAATEPTAGPVKTWMPPATTEPTAPQAEPEVAAEPPPSDPPMTKVQQRKIGRLMSERDVTEDTAILAQLGKFLGRAIVSPAEVTRDEAIQVLAYLEDNPAGTPPRIMGAQWSHAAQMLDQLGATDDAQKLNYLRAFFNRDDLADPMTLTEGEGDELTDELTRQVVAAEDPAGQTVLDTEGGDR